MILIAWDGGHQCAIFRFSTRDVLRVGLSLNDLSWTGCHRCNALNFMLELRESADTHQLWCGLKFLESLLGRSETWSAFLSLYHSYCQHLWPSGFGYFVLLYAIFGHLPWKVAEWPSKTCLQPAWLLARRLDNHYTISEWRVASTVKTTH